MAQWFLDHGHAAVRLHPPQWDLRSIVHVERVVALVEQAYARGFRILRLDRAAMHSLVELAAYQRG
eukprot:13821054-Heterocapsa_arctica.AAC.1